MLAAELEIFILIEWGLSALVIVEADGEIGRSGLTAREGHQGHLYRFALVAPAWSKTLEELNGSMALLSHQ